jgi:hypothetical protein
MSRARLLAALALAALPLAIPSIALAQQPAKPKPTGAPPGTKTDMEIDPDSKPAEPAPLPPPEPGQWGVGGKEEEGKFSPGADKKKEKEEKEKAKAEEEAKPVDLGPARTAGIDMVIGFGSIRDITNDSGLNNGKTRVTSISFIFAFNWRVAEIWNLGARFPFTKATITGPQDTTKDDYNTFASGNLELYVKPSFKLTPRLRLPAMIAVDMPTAQGDLMGDLTADGRVPLAQALVNQSAAAARGWEENPLFASKRFGLRAGAGITYDTEHVHVAASTRFDLMVKAFGKDALTGFNVASPTTAWVTNASFFYGIGVGPGFIEPGLRTWLAVASTPVTTPTRDYSGAQFVVEPAVNARFSVNADKTMWAKGGLGFLLPVSGPLGGANAPFDATIRGFRVNAEFSF